MLASVGTTDNYYIVRSVYREPRSSSIQAFTENLRGRNPRSFAQRAQVLKKKKHCFCKSRSMLKERF